jgi:hypothetical protein
MNLADNFLFCGVLNLVDNDVGGSVEVEGIKGRFISCMGVLFFVVVFGFFGVLMLCE